MSVPITIPTRLPQTGDSVATLAARSLMGPTAETVAIASGTYTTNQTTSLISAGGCKGVMVHANCTAITGGASLQTQLQIPCAGDWTTLAIIGTTTVVGARTLVVYPGASNVPVNGAAAPMVLPAQFRIVAVVTPSAGDVTFSVNYQLIP